MRDAFVNALLSLAKQNSNFILITADLGFGVFDQFEKQFPTQYLNVGVAEQNMIGIATGLGLEGKTVFVYSIANFSTLRCLEQIRNDASYHGVNLTVVSSGGGFTYGALGMSHHATEDLGILRTLPGITVVAPCTAWESEQAALALAALPGVGYLRIEKGGDKTSRDTFQLGKSHQMREGNACTFFVAGGVMSEVIDASNRLAQEGLEVRIVSMHTIKPIDQEAILNAAKETQGIITVEEHNVIGGLGSAVAEVLAEANVPYGFFKRCGLPDVYSSIVGSQEYLRKRFSLDADALYKIAKDLIENDTTKKGNEIAKAMF